MTTNNSAAAAENTGPRKRGRPKIMTPADEQLCNFWFPEVKSERGRQDVFYRQRAMEHLADQPGLNWLRDEEAMTAGARNAWKPSVLAELGRIDDPEAMLTAAHRVVHLKPRTCKAAVAMIRRWRRGNTAAACPVSLAAAMVRGIDAYAATHPDTSNKHILDALKWVPILLDIPTRP